MRSACAEYKFHQNAFKAKALGLEDLKRFLRLNFLSVVRKTFKI